MESTAHFGRDLILGDGRCSIAGAIGVGCLGLVVSGQVVRVDFVILSVEGLVSENRG